MMCPRAQTELKEEVISWIDSCIIQLGAILTAAVFILVYKNVFYLYTRKKYPYSDTKLSLMAYCPPPPKARTPSKS